ncbi:ATP-binding protein [Paenibacillus sp. LHD-117]|uniref:ATP-binding protein n=1 Tax=Paenibacillus sp. LHD-117 TaxID=3071412 RepID=UPI0027E0069F|nr:ATP-binding protein [Paenibacillus sp. LHD-117]MDQ6421186.1 ATP-binding protein [Paenibacillus sp. LHD-117]
MLKDLLLQFFLSVLPVFAFLLWHDKERGWRGFKPFIAIASGVAMILCALTASLVHEYDVDFRMVPFLIGSLYGGYRAFLGLGLLYISLRIPSLDNDYEIWGFLVFILLFSVMLLAVIRKFQLASNVHKERIGIMMMGIITLYLIILTKLYMWAFNMPWTFFAIISTTIAIIGLLLAIWLSIYIIESIKEKQQLYLEVNQLSVSYGNEVQKLQQFIDKVPIAVLIVDAGGMITHVNEESVKLLGFRETFQEVGKLKNVSYLDAFDPNRMNRGADLLSQALQGDSAATLPHEESQLILILTSVTLRDIEDHRITGAALIAKDITELSQLRDERGRMERLSLVGQMAASITHEIRNPMAVIRGFVQLIQERSPQNQFEYFRIIMEELDRANLIISDFLSLAQNRELKMEKASLHATINDIVPLLLADANLRGQTLEVQLCDNLPQMLLNDREMKQLLLNLARNGMEAMDDKGVLKLITTCTNEEISVHISDEGVGIPADKIDHLFEPFYTTKTRGTGLGLPLCLSIAERHNGRIDVRSREGEGTTFIVTFDIRVRAIEHTIP